MPVDFAEQLAHLASQPAHEFGHQLSGDPVAAVHDDPHVAREAYVGGDAPEISLAHIRLDHLAVAGRQIALHDPSPQIPDFVTGKSLSCEYDLEAVVLGGVVAAGYHHA